MTLRMREAGIYLVREGDRTYVGKSANLRRRRYEHLSWRGRFSPNATFIVLERYKPLPNPIVLGEPLFYAREVEARQHAWLAERESFWFDLLRPTDNKVTPLK